MKARQLRFDQNSGAHFQRLGEPVNVQQRNVTFTALHPTNVGAVQTSFFGELLLGNSAGSADRSYISAESDQDVIHWILVYAPPRVASTPFEYRNADQK